MTLVERLFRLRAIPPFDRLSEAELALIAESAVERHYEPGKCVATKDKPARALFITLEGSLTDREGNPLPSVLPPVALLNGTPLPSDVLASAQKGAVCLLIQKGHFFTILYECPALAVGFIEISRETGTSNPGLESWR
jgi:signal-transduction protein with cAMP-binding, CBS, and nucleotidyltransferase domain